MQLLDLPPEILCSLPLYLRNIEDYTSAASSCRTLRDCFATAKPSTILRLAASAAPTFFSPHPHFLVMSTARQVADWAIGNDANTARMQQAFQGGIDGLLDLCVEVAGLTMAEIRRLHLARFTIINPLTDLIDKMAGNQWYATPNFWSGGVSEPETISCEPERATFQIIIYGELFASTMQSFLEPEKHLPRFGLDTRLEYVKYIIPDWNCARGYPGMHVEKTGPYADPESYVGDQIALRHVLMSSRWQRLWEPVLREIGPDFDVDDWRRKLWWGAPQTLGLEGMELITSMKKSGLSDEWIQRLTTIRHQIESLEEKDKPKLRPIGPTRPDEVSEAPELWMEVQTCMASYWGRM